MIHIHIFILKESNYILKSAKMYYYFYKEDYDEVKFHMRNHIIVPGIIFQRCNFFIAFIDASIEKS